MQCRRMAWGWVLLLGGAAGTNAVSAQSTPNGVRSVSLPRPTAPAQGFVAAPVPLEELAPAVRPRVAGVLEHPTLSARGQLEAFHCRPNLYFWLLDHPDAAARLWRSLGAKCTDILARNDGGFSWKDAQNGEIHWHPILRTPRQHIWYAEGRVRPGVLLPSVPVRAVVVMNHQEGSDGNGKAAVRHQMDMILHTDSRAVKLATRLFGASAPRLAEEYVGQMEMFFGALAWYLTQHPDKAAEMLSAVGYRQSAVGQRTERGADSQ